MLGENGAGKTTLMRILYGLTIADAGTIEVDGQRRRVRSPQGRHRRRHGHGHPALLPGATHDRGREPGPGPRVRACAWTWTAARANVRAASERCRHRGRPGCAGARTCPSGQQQRVEILKALSRDCRVLIMDEPTAVLVPQEVEALFATLRRLVADGLAIIFISHKLGEVRAISDRVSVLRRGRLIGTVPGDTDERELARHDGRPPDSSASQPASRRRPPAAPTPVLRVEGLSAAGAHGLPALRDVSLRSRAGEIVGVAGRVGQRPDRARGGARRDAPAHGGRVAGRRHGRHSRGAPVRGDGRGHGPHPRGPPREPGAGPVRRHQPDPGAHRRLPRPGRPGRAAHRGARAGAHRAVRIKAAPGDRVGTLSGGNIQKVLLARVLSRDPRVVVVSQPTRGLDVGATEYVRGELLARRAAGAAILLVSEDLDELLALSDRLIVLYEGASWPSCPPRAPTRSTWACSWPGGAPRQAGCASARRAHRRSIGHGSVLGSSCGIGTLASSSWPRSRSRRRRVLIAGASPIDA